MEYIPVRDHTVPAIGLGTYRLRGSQCRTTVETALELGYRHIDTAEFYDNQTAVGEAIANSSVDRDELFLTTKVWRTNLRYDDVRQSVRDSLDALGQSYVDLLLIHWPTQSVPIGETITAMNELQSEGKVDYIGVSNFSLDQLQEAIESSTTPIFTNQVEYHPYTNQSELIDWCFDNEILVTAYSPLDKGTVGTDDTLAAIGKRYNKSPVQVALRWLIQQEIVAAIPKATSRSHLEANIDIFDFELTDAEMNRIFELQGGIVSSLRRRLGI